MIGVRGVLRLGVAASAVALSGRGTARAADALVIGTDGVHIDNLDVAHALTAQSLMVSSNVGIGAAGQPGVKLHVAGPMKIDGNNVLEFGAGVSPKQTDAGKIGYQTWTTGSLDIVGAGTTGDSRKIKFWAEGGATFAGSLTVTGNATTRALTVTENTATGSLTVSGNAGIGTGTAVPKAKLQVSGVGGVNVDLIVNGRLRSDNNDGGLWIASDRFVGGYETDKIGLWNNNAWRLGVRSNGQVEVFGDLFVRGSLIYWWGPDNAWKHIENRANNYAGSYSSGAPSDIRFKTALRPIRNALQKVLQLNGTCYRWDKVGLSYFTRHIADMVSAGPDTTEDDNQRLSDAERQKAYEALSGDQIGLIAQELESVVPELVCEDEEGYKYVRYQQLTALLVEAMKEQNALIQSLAGRLAAVEGR